MRLLLPVIALPALLFLPSVSSAKVLITRGDTFSHLGEIAAKKRTPELPANITSIGFKYAYFGIFWLDLWRYDGEYCIYHDKEYVPISKAVAAEMMGVPESSLQEPIWYTFPPGALILGGLLAIGAVAVVLKQIRKQKVMAIVGDPRYQKALDVFREQVALNEAAKQQAVAPVEEGMPEPEPVNPETLPDPWEAAINSLTSSGIERPEAEENFGKVLGYAMNQANEAAAAEAAANK